MLPFSLFMSIRQPGEGCEGCLIGKRIVLIEEDAVTAWQLTRALKRAGLDIVATENNGPQGVEGVVERQPDIVVIDGRQPILHCLEVARRILERRQVCIILLTDRENEADRQKARQSGVSSVLVKPLTGHDLKASMEKAYTDFHQT